jgi:hypothetical protein
MRLDDDGATFPTVTDQDGARQGERLHNSRNIGAEPFDRTFSRRTWARPIPAQINRDCRVTRSKMGHQSVPAAVRAGEPIDEDNRRRFIDPARSALFA